MSLPAPYAECVPGADTHTHAHSHTYPSGVLRSPHSAFLAFIPYGSPRPPGTLLRQGQKSAVSAAADPPTLSSRPPKIYGASSFVIQHTCNIKEVKKVLLFFHDDCLRRSCGR